MISKEGALRVKDNEPMKGGRMMPGQHVEWVTSDKTGIYSRLAKERLRQFKKWGTQNHSPVEWLSIIAEELGEAHEIVNKTFEGGRQKLDRVHLEQELVETAACCVAALESFNRTMGPQEYR